MAQCFPLPAGTRSLPSRAHDPSSRLCPLNPGHILSLESEQSIILGKECYWKLTCCPEGRMEGKQMLSSVKAEDYSCACFALFGFFCSWIVVWPVFSILSPAGFKSSHTPTFLPLKKSLQQRHIRGLRTEWPVRVVTGPTPSVQHSAHHLQQLFAWCKVLILTHLEDNFTW